MILLNGSDHWQAYGINSYLSFLSLPETHSSSSHSFTPHLLICNARKSSCKFSRSKSSRRAACRWQTKSALFFWDLPMISTPAFYQDPTSITITTTTTHHHYHHYHRHHHHRQPLPASPPSFIHHHLLRLPPPSQVALGTRHVTDSPSPQVDERWACLPAARCPAPITARTLAAGAPT